MNYNKEELLEIVENSSLEQKKAWSFVLLVLMDHLRKERDTQTRKREKVRITVAITKINEAFKVYQNLIKEKQNA
jgi:hypothetical protein